MAKRKLESPYDKKTGFSYDQRQLINAMGRVQEVNDVLHNELASLAKEPMGHRGRGQVWNLLQRQPELLKVIQDKRFSKLIAAEAESANIKREGRKVEKAEQLEAAKIAKVTVKAQRKADRLAAQRTKKFNRQAKKLGSIGQVNVNGQLCDLIPVK